MHPPLRPTVRGGLFREKLQNYKNYAFPITVFIYRQIRQIRRLQISSIMPTFIIFFTIVVFVVIVVPPLFSRISGFSFCSWNVVFVVCSKLQNP